MTHALHALLLGGPLFLAFIAYCLIASFVFGYLDGLTETSEGTLGAVWCGTLWPVTVFVFLALLCVRPWLRLCIKVKNYAFELGDDVRLAKEEAES